MKKLATKKASPTKEEIKAARVAMRAARKVLALSNKKSRRFVRRRVPVEQDFYVWHHDFETLLASTARDSELSPSEIVDRAAIAADRMAEIIKAREPADNAEVGMLRRSRRRRPWGAQRLWREWQSMFDSLLHSLVLKTSLSAEDVLARAEAVADKAMMVTDARRKRMIKVRK